MKATLPFYNSQLCNLLLEIFLRDGARLISDLPIKIIDTASVARQRRSKCSTSSRRRVDHGIIKASRIQITVSRVLTPVGITGGYQAFDIGWCREIIHQMD